MKARPLFTGRQECGMTQVTMMFWVMAWAIVKGGDGVSGGDAASQGECSWGVTDSDQLRMPTVSAIPSPVTGR
jgi:hypothetical protein